MKIVPLAKENLDDVTNLAMKLWPDNKWDELWQEFAELVDSDQHQVYVAISEDSCIGFIHMALRHDYVEGSRTSPVGYIEGIYVDENSRFKGIARKLIEQGENWAREKGCTELASDAELHNVASQVFHKKIGFREAGKIVAFIKDINGL